MATYNSRNDDTVVFGREFKLNVSMDPDGDYHMENVDFFCHFTAGGKCVILKKSDMIRVDADNYVAPLDSKVFGKVRKKLYGKGASSTTDFVLGNDCV